MQKPLVVSSSNHERRFEDCEILVLLDALKYP